MTGSQPGAQEQAMPVGQEAPAGVAGGAPRIEPIAPTQKAFIKNLSMKDARRSLERIAAGLTRTEFLTTQNARQAKIEQLYKTGELTREEAQQAMTILREKARNTFINTLRTERAINEMKKSSDPISRALAYDTEIGLMQHERIGLHDRMERLQLAKDQETDPKVQKQYDQEIKSIQIKITEILMEENTLIDERKKVKTVSGQEIPNQLVAMINKLLNTESLDENQRAQAEEAIKDNPIGAIEDIIDEGLLNTNSPTLNALIDRCKNMGMDEKSLKEMKRIIEGEGKNPSKGEKVIKTISLMSIILMFLIYQSIKKKGGVMGG